MCIYISWIYFAIILNKLLDQLRIKIIGFVVPSLIHSPITFLSVCTFEFFTYIIFLLPKDHLLIFHVKYVNWPHTSSNFVSLRKSSSLLKDTFTTYRIPGELFFCLFVFLFLYCCSATVVPTFPPPTPTKYTMAECTFSDIYARWCSLSFLHVYLEVWY